MCLFAGTFRAIWRELWRSSSVLLSVRLSVVGAPTQATVRKTAWFQFPRAIARRSVDQFASTVCRLPSAVCHLSPLVFLEQRLGDQRASSKYPGLSVRSSVKGILIDGFSLCGLDERNRSAPGKARGRQRIDLIGRTATIDEQGCRFPSAPILRLLVLRLVLRSLLLRLMERDGGLFCYTRITPVVVFLRRKHVIFHLMLAFGDPRSKPI